MQNAGCGNLQRVKCGKISAENKCGMKGKRRKISAEKLK